MAYITYYLKAPDEDTAKQAARNADIGLLTEDDNGDEIWSSYSNSKLTAIDSGFKIWKTEPEIDKNGNVVTEGELEPGFFANLNVKDIPEAQNEFDTLINEAKKLGIEVRQPTKPKRTFL